MNPRKKDSAHTTELLAALVKAEHGFQLLAHNLSLHTPGSPLIQWCKSGEEDARAAIARRRGNEMSPAEYKAARKQRGTQAEVAAALDIKRETVSRRETGDAPINREAELALTALPKKKTHLR